ncbi:MAG: DUF5103 domain-containing protein [Flavobacteriaceae bacterium]|nr:DUF5103 domain-containing protein [Flavobacteriaceae bacterium]
MKRNLIFLIFFCGLLSAQQIRTAQLFNPQSNDLSPFINIKNDYLIFSFDDMEGGSKRFDYKIVRYDRFWQPSSLFLSEYISGYETNYIRDYRSSFNTRVNYTHYEVQIPNRDFSFKLSGNYGIQLLHPQNKSVILEKRFAVYENATAVGVHVERINGFNNENQRISVQVASTNQIDLTRNQQESMMVVLKNDNWNERIVLQQPVFAQAFQFTYNQMTNLFSGGVEYNWFDTKNSEIAGLTTEKIIRDDIYKVVLRPDAFAPDQTYLDRPDVNGNYYIRNDRIPNPLNAGSEADYMDVYFGLSQEKPAANESIFVYGAFNNFYPTPESILQYVPTTGLWETNILLKQGYYNYSYGIINNDTGEIDYDKISGSYWQTENKYSALFYYQPWGKRYDLLLGYGEGYSRPSQR